MFFHTFTITFKAIVQALLIGACGYVGIKKKIINTDGIQQLSVILVNIMLPLFIFYEITENFNFREFGNWWLFPLISIAMTGTAFLLGNAVLAVSGKTRDKKEILTMMTFQNAGYIPLIIVASLFTGAVKENLYVYIFLFIPAFNMGMWTLGVWLITQKELTKTDIKKIFNPPFRAVCLALLFNLLGWHRYIPRTVLNPMEMLGSCVLPLSMFVVGANLAGMNLSDTNVKGLSLYVLTKLVLMPLLALGFVLAVPVDSVIGFLIMIEAAAPSAVTLSIIARYYNVPERFISQGLFYGLLLSTLTLPVFLALYMTLKGVS